MKHKEFISKGFEKLLSKIVFAVFSFPFNIDFVLNKIIKIFISFLNLH